MSGAEVFEHVRRVALQRQCVETDSPTDMGPIYITKNQWKTLRDYMCTVLSSRDPGTVMELMIMGHQVIAK